MLFAVVLAAARLAAAPVRVTGVSSQPEEPPRTYLRVDPARRPRIIRATVRVIMVDEHDQTLLFLDSDPGCPGVTWWIEPGGGIDPGETYEQTAVREVAEETGYDLDPVHLRGPVAERYVVHGYSDQVIEQDEVFFVARVAHFDLDVSGHTLEEQLTMLGHRWWRRADLARTDEAIWPNNLLQLWDLAECPERWPLQLGRMEESTVPDVR